MDSGATAFSVPVAISGGDHYVLAVKGDGTVVAWGQSSYGQTSVPSGLSNVVSVAGGFFHCLALNSTGGVSAWGDNSYNECDPPYLPGQTIAIAAGGPPNRSGWIPTRAGPVLNPLPLYNLLDLKSA